MPSRIAETNPGLPSVQRNVPANLELAGTGLVLLAIYAVLYNVVPAAYDYMMRMLAFRAWKYPFFDAQGLLAPIACWHQGFDVYAATPCDPLGRPMVYSPLWLRLPAPPLGPGWLNVFGLTLVAVFIAALAGLPRPSGRFGRATMVLALASPLVSFGVERGNVDLLMFALAVLAAVAMERSPAVRLGGYAVALLAGLLKFYPLVLLVLAVREGVRRCLALWLVAGAVVVCFVCLFWSELVRIPPHMPVPGVDAYDAFGAWLLLSGAAELASRALQHRIPAGLLAAVPAVLGMGLPICAVAAACALARKRQLMAPLLLLAPREASCLFAGSLLFCGCFFAAPNIGYRAVYFLLVLPGVLAALAAATTQRVRLLWGTTALAILAVLWLLPVERSVAWRAGVPGHPFAAPATIGFWLGREAVWWAIAIVLLAVIIRAVLGSAAWQQLSAGKYRSALRTKPDVPSAERT
jgi:hypothetical protein